MLLLLLQSGASSISCSIKLIFTDANIFSWWWYRRVNANTLIGGAILFSGHSYLWDRYCEPIIHLSNATVFCSLHAVDILMMVLMYNEEAVESLTGNNDIVRLPECTDNSDNIPVMMSLRMFISVMQSLCKSHLTTVILDKLLSPCIHKQLLS